ncbi:RHS repeat-associated core domain-containing protein [Stenotrophomonas sp. SRS1]|uniref:RHS repeat-associated core domain-containing protein n=1 Tax=Stenotrophomonas sp. SRS1 TaxID=2870345 RepID=UPI0022383F55|nr:RHS repeat-associated core domain-containing protein [Stenotrophomonas sp. SRS1]
MLAAPSHPKIQLPCPRTIGVATADRPGFTGHVRDGATFLSYMEQRYYDPRLGVFLSIDEVTAESDPVGMFNRYRYAANNPYRYADPNGRFYTSTGQCMTEAEFDRAWRGGKASAKRNWKSPWDCLGYRRWRFSRCNCRRGAIESSGWEARCRGSSCWWIRVQRPWSNTKAG